LFPGALPSHVQVQASLVPLRLQMNLTLVATHPSNATCSIIAL
jgi:hypothetical protein